MQIETYKGYRITADIYDHSGSHRAVKWEVMQKVKNGWEGIEAFVDNIEKEVTDKEALEFGLRNARKYVDGKL